MTKREIALEYLRCFCEASIDGIESLLAPGLKFTGTLGEYQSAAHYLDALRSDPPQNASCTILSITEADDSVAVFYDYHRPDRVITVAQLFTVRGQRIHEMRVVFDARGFV